MNRRHVIQLLGASCALAALHARAQPVRKMARVGILSGRSQEDSNYLISIFKEAMRDLGWIDKRNVEYIERYAYGDSSRWEVLAAELLAERVDIILTTNADMAKVAAKAAASLPIVFALGADPVGTGAVASLARPGGNITGFSTSNAEIGEKRVQLLMEIRPKFKRVAMLVSAGESEIYGKPVMDATRKLGIAFQRFIVKRPDEIRDAFDAIARWKAEGLLITANPQATTERRQIVDHAARIRVPVVYASSVFVTAGGLMSYAADFADNYRGAAGYVDRILKGAKPADLPVQQPTKFELILNMKTAKALGITIPRSILVQATKVIE